MMVNRNAVEQVDLPAATSKLLELISEENVDWETSCSLNPNENHQLMLKEVEDSVSDVDTTDDLAYDYLEQGKSPIHPRRHDDDDNEDASLSFDEVSSCPKTELARQINSSLSQPGAFRMRGPTTRDNDDESSNGGTITTGTVQMQQDERLVVPTVDTPPHNACDTLATEQVNTPTHSNPESSSTILLVSAQLVSEHVLPDGDVVEAAAGGSRLVSERGGSGSRKDDILTAAPLEDMHIVRHLLRQRRVQTALCLLCLVFVVLVVGMVAGLSYDREPTVVVISNNGTTTSIHGEQAERYTDSMDFD